MEKELTKQDILELFAQQAKQISQQSKNFENLLLKEREERNQSRKEFDKKLLETDKRIGQLAGTWGKFVAEMVQPKIVEMFQEKGIQIRTSIQNVKGYIGDERHYEIDLLLINSNIAVVVEIKSSLSVEDVKEHLERLEKIQKVQPERVNLSGVTIYGAVAGMIVENDADKYAYKKGLFVLRQKGNIVEIVNDSKFKPKEWKVDY